MFTEYSAWFIPLITAVAAAFAFFTYFSRIGKDTHFTKKQRLCLALFRFLSLLLILFLLLSPVKTVKHKTISKPVIVFAQDNSQSVAYAYKDKDKNVLDKYLKDRKKLITNLEKDYDVRQLTISNITKESDTLSFDGLATDIEDCFKFIADNFSQENLSAVILATDGIATQGTNAANLADNCTYPVYTVMMGDTSVRKDIYITDIQYNKITFTDTEYPISVTVRADKAKNSQATLFMVKDGKTTALKTFTADKDDYFVSTKTKTVSLKPGAEKISFYVSTIDGETNKENNRKDIFIEVLDAKKKILIAAAAPHPDVAALKNALESNNGYTVEVLNSADELSKAKDCNLIILHNIPNNQESFNAVKQLQSKNTNMLFIIGKDINVPLFNALKTGLSLSKMSAAESQVLAVYNPSFSLFSLDGSITDMLRKMPPLLTVTAKYNISAGVQTLFFEKIGQVNTSNPLISFNTQNPNGKYGFINGENLWRWRLYNFMINSSHAETDAIIAKSVQLLGDKTDKQRFRVEHKDVYQQNENIVFTAQLYNDNYELINTPDVSLKIKSSSSEYSYVLGRTNNAYYINTGFLPQGEYSFTAKTSYSGKDYVKNGKFSVASVNNELTLLTAMHGQLATVSQ